MLGTAARALLTQTCNHAAGTLAAFRGDTSEPKCGWSCCLQVAPLCCHWPRSMACPFCLRTPSTAPSSSACRCCASVCCACVCAWACVCVRARPSERALARVPVHACVCMCVCACVRVRVRVRAQEHEQGACLPTPPRNPHLRTPCRACRKDPYVLWSIGRALSHTASGSLLHDARPARQGPAQHPHPPASQHYPPTRRVPCIMMQGLPDKGLRRIILTASGGAFRDWPVEKLKEVRTTGCACACALALCA